MCGICSNYYPYYCPVNNDKLKTKTMRIELITSEEYNAIVEIQKNNPKLTFQNVGYQYIDKREFSEEDKKAFEDVTALLRSHVCGFSEFNNFRHSKDNELIIRLQYNYNHDSEGCFIGVGYLLVTELLNGFND